MSSFQIGEFTKLTAELKSIVKEKKLTWKLYCFTDKIKKCFNLTQFDTFNDITKRGGPTSVLEAMLIGCLLFLQTWGCSDDREWN
jgi:hypothetical protein